jgi:hypothetical protein
LLAAESEHALSAPDADDESAFCEDDGNLSRLGARGRADADDASESDGKSNTCGKFPHDLFSSGLLRRLMRKEHREISLRGEQIAGGDAVDRRLRAHAP